MLTRIMCKAVRRARRARSARDLPGKRRDGLRGLAGLVGVILGVAAWGQEPPTPDDPAESTNMTLSVAWSARDVYIGEAITLSFVWDCRLPFENIKAVDIRVPLLRDKAFKDVARAPETMTPAPGSIGLPVNETRTIGTRQGNRIRFEKVVVPLVAGTRTVPPASLTCSVIPRETHDGFQYPSYFDNQFFEPDGRVRRRREFVRTEPAVLRVHPLPDTGRPAGFSGLVGACKITAAAWPASVQVGDPVTLELSVSGHPHPEIIPMPGIETSGVFLKDFEFSGDGAVPVTRDGARVFRYTIRPRHAAVTEIPCVTLSFFNADTQSYRTSSSEPVTIEVSDAEIANAFDAVLNDGTRLKNTLRLSPDGVMQDHADAWILSARKSVWGISRASTWLLLVLPPVLYLLMRLATAETRLARRDPAAARARRAYRRYRRCMAGLSDGTDAPSPHGLATCDHALREYLADRFGLRAGALTFADVAPLLEARGLTAEERSVVRDVMQAHHAMLYAEPVPPLLRNTPSAVTLSKTIARLERLFLLVLVLVPVSVSAALSSVEFQPNRADVAELVCRAQAHMQAAHAAADDPARAGALYATAAATYEHVLDRGIRNGQLYYNLGNAWYWAGDRGRALLNYRRAELYLPGDPDVVHNIACVREESRDAVSPSMPALCEQYLLFRDARLNRRLRAGLLAGCWIALWVFLALALFRKDRRLARVLRLLTLAVVVLLTSLLADATAVARLKNGVILDSQVVGRKGNARIYEPAFNTPIHAGTECRILEARGDWTRVRLRNGYSCWIPSSSVGSVY